MTTKPQLISAPEPLAPVPFKIPEPFETKLANGLKVVLFSDDRLPLISLRLAFGSGDAADLESSGAVSSATASMITEGTQNSSSRQLAEQIERLGASISASSSDDFTIVGASALSLYTSEVLRLIEEILLTSNFPETEIDLYRRNTLEHLKFQRSQPNFLASEHSARLLFGEHPYSKVSPTPADVERLTRGRLLEFKRKHYVPNNATLIIVGDINQSELLRQVEERFSGWQQSEVHEDQPFAIPERVERSLTIVDRPGSAQSNIVLANIAIERDNEDYFPFLVMNQVLGAGASSRVFMNLREEKGYTYGAYTRFDAKRLAGDFEATAEVRTAVTGDSLKEFFFELDRIRTEKVSDEELIDAKNFLTGVFPIRAETQEGLTNLIVTQYLYDLPADYLQTYREQVSAVTVEDVHRVANKYVNPQHAALVIVGDAGEILSQASAFAETVEIFDTEGNAKSMVDYSTTPDGEPANAAGNWLLTLDFQGQSLPVSMTLQQDGTGVSGSIETMLGTGRISEGSLAGEKLSATVITEIQGEQVEFEINGKIAGDSLTGLITTPLAPDPLPFNGSRSV
ncbi:MAG: pitrilysin family protein [Pyrinomonadaceae bacterium]